MQAPNLSENSWAGAAVLVAGLLCSVVSLVAVFSSDTTIRFAVVAAVGWTLSVCLFVVGAMNRRRISQLETEVEARKRQLDEWAGAASNTSQAAKAVAEFAISVQRPSAPRRQRKQAVKDDAQ